MVVDAGNPIALSSDAHVPDQLGHGYDQALELLDEVGVRELVRLRAPRAPAGADRPHVSTATGIGWDSHRLVPGRPLVLGGIEIPHPRAWPGTPTPTC